MVDKILLLGKHFCLSDGITKAEPLKYKISTACLTVILFIVSVPVLSLAITVALPSVSKDSNFLTNTLFSPKRVAIIARVEVTVAGSPYGTLAIIIMINPSMKARIIGAP